METTVIQSALRKLLSPLIRLLIRLGMSCDEFTEIARRSYVEVATRDFQLDGRKQTISRVSMLTGIQRKEVSRLQKLIDSGETSLDSAYNRGARITSGWRRDPEFSSRGRARSLPLDGENSFAELVRKYSGDLPYRAVLDELLRAGVVDKGRGNTIRLSNEAGYIPSASETDQLNILGNASADLLETMTHNIHPDTTEKRLQLTVDYDNLPLEAVEKFKVMAQRDGFALLKQFDEWLSARDRDTNLSVIPVNDRHRAGVGIYFFQEPVLQTEGDT